MEGRVNTTGRDCTSEEFNDNDYCLTTDEYIGEILAYLRPTPYEIVLLCLYSIVLLAGLLGNALVMVAVLFKQTMRTATNMFLVNLALADFLVILLCLAPTVIEDVMESWVFGDLACRVLKYLQPVSVTVSVLTMTFNSVERLLAICFPMKVKTTKRRIGSLIILTWTIALASKLHYPFTMEAIPFPKLPNNTVLLTACRSNWKIAGPNGTVIVNMEVGASIADSVLFFVLPFAWMLYAYSMVCHRLWHAAVPGEVSSVRNRHRSYSRCSTNRFSGTTSKTTSGPSTSSAASAASPDATLAQRRRTALMLICIVIIFFVCNLPVHIMRVANLYLSGKEFTHSQHHLKTAIQYIAGTSHWICYFNSAINPIVYNVLSAKFRAEFLRIIKRCLPRCCRRSYGAAEGLSALAQSEMLRHRRPAVLLTTGGNWMPAMALRM